MRLIERRCGNRLGRYKRRLEALDECLGEYHNFALLRTILSADPFVSRQETARRLRIIKRYQTDLRPPCLRARGPALQRKAATLHPARSGVLAAHERARVTFTSPRTGHAAIVPPQRDAPFGAALETAGGRRFAAMLAGSAAPSAGAVAVEDRVRPCPRPRNRHPSLAAWGMGNERRVAASISWAAAAVAVVAIASVGAASWFRAEVVVDGRSEPRSAAICAGSSITTYSECRCRSTRSNGRETWSSVSPATSRRSRPFITSAVLGMALDAITIVGMLVVMFWLDLQFSLIGLSIAPLLFVLVNGLSRRIKTAARAVKQKDGELASVAEESLSSARVVKTLSREEFEERRFDRGPRESLSHAASAPPEGPAVATRRCAHRGRDALVLLASGSCWPGNSPSGSFSCLCFTSSACTGP